MPAVELECETCTERKTRDVWPLESKRVDERGQTACITVRPKHFRWIGRAAAAGRVPSHDVELVRELLQLRAPFAAIAEPSVEEDEWRPLTRPSVGDAKPVDLDVRHEDET